MKCGETKTHMVRMLNRIGVSLLILLIYAVCYLLFTMALRGIEKKNAIKLFQQNSIEFDTAYYTMQRDSSGHKDFSSLFNGVKHFSVPEELTKLSIDEIFLSNDNLFFHLGFQVLNMIPHGYVYINKLEEIPNWYKLTNIDGKWYYYSIPP